MFGVRVMARPRSPPWRWSSEADRRAFWDGQFGPDEPLRRGSDAPNSAGRISGVPYDYVVTEKQLPWQPTDQTAWETANVPDFGGDLGVGRGVP